MRLLDTLTGHFVEFYDTANIRYAILSHMWDPDGEQTYQDVREIQEFLIKAHGTTAGLGPPFPSPGPQTSIQAEPIPGFWDDKKLSEKIRKACEIARSYGYRYLWIDSCCIDKTSSSELSEAINSMYAWYGCAAICYAFLADVPHEDVPDSDQSAFRRSRWFRRGWTLQELIAPRRLVFLSREWQTLGLKSSMAGLVEQITRIDRKVLTHHLSLDETSVARRMSWAANRETTRVEDRAYSLLGIFDLNIPTLYGEGKRAFRRLQEEILRRIPDQTLFAWNEDSAWPCLPDTGPGFSLQKWSTSSRDSNHYTIHISHTETLFGPSPSSFIHAGPVDITPEDDYLGLLGLSEIPHPDYSLSPYGIRSTFPVVPLQQHSNPITVSVSDGDISNWYLVFLSCHRPGELQSLGPHLLARVCRIAPSRSSAKVAVMTVGRISSVSYSMVAKNIDRLLGSTLFTVTADQLKSLRRLVQVRSVYLPHPDRTSLTPSPSVYPFLRDCRFLLALSSYTSTALRVNGYEVELHTPPSRQTTERLLTHSLILRRRDRVLQINIDEIRPPPFRRLSAAAWSFTVAEAQAHTFPLSSYQSPCRRDDVDEFHPGWGCRLLIDAGRLRRANHSEAVTMIRLELEEASSDSSVSHYLHVDIEEL